MSFSPLWVRDYCRLERVGIRPDYRDEPAMEAKVDLEHLREFRVLAKELHFGHAADKSYASRTAFSRHICELESYFGVQLIERSHPARLTPAGTMLAQYLEDVVPSYYALKAALHDVGCPTAASRHHGDN